MNDSRKWDGMEGGCGRIESQKVRVVFLKENNGKHVKNQMNEKRRGISEIAHSSGPEGPHIRAFHDSI